MTDEETRKLLREFNCPYGMRDPRTKPWLEGYQAGHDYAAAKAVESLDRIAGKQHDPH